MYPGAPSRLRVGALLGGVRGAERGGVGVAARGRAHGGREQRQRGVGAQQPGQLQQRGRGRRVLGAHQLREQRARARQEAHEAALAV